MNYSPVSSQLNIIMSHVLDVDFVKTLSKFRLLPQKSLDITIIILSLLPTSNTSDFVYEGSICSCRYGNHAIFEIKISCVLNFVQICPAGLV